MHPPPNGIFIAFSFLGFVMCAIPFYWYLETWNAGTCLYMAWVGLGCLMQFINSIVWNKNTIDKAPVYCDISTRIQVGLNAAIPACSLCIIRRLYKIATANGAMPTGAEKRSAVITDLLIGLGIPILQIILQYIVSGHRYNIFEDFGPYHATTGTLPALFLFTAWPLVIGLVSFSYGARSVYAFYKRQRRFKEMMSATPGLNHGRYFRLMALSSLDIFLTIPITVYIIVLVVKQGVVPWISWDDTHFNYSRVIQVPGFVWRNESITIQGLEMYRWSLVLCAFVFFAFFGFADEARQHYRLVYNSLARRIGYRTSSGPFNGLPHAKGGATVPVVTMPRERRNPTVPFSDQLSFVSTFIADDLEPSSKIKQSPSSDSMESPSVDSIEPEPHSQPSSQSLATTSTVPSASVPLHHPETSESTQATYSSAAANSV